MLLMELSFPIKQQELRKKTRIKKSLKTALRKKDAVSKSLEVESFRHFEAEMTEYST